MEVTEYADGDTPNGVRQLIGNVWEWINNAFVLDGANGLEVAMPDESGGTPWWRVRYLFSRTCYLPISIGSGLNVPRQQYRISMLPRTGWADIKTQPRRRIMTTISYRVSDTPEVGSEESGPPCVCCGMQLSDLDAYCNECQTPSEVSSSAAASDLESDFISVLGASNAGKTVYLGLLLDVLGGPSGLIRGSAKGTFSISLQEQVVTALQQRRFPGKTPTESDMWKWLHCEVSLTSAKKTRQANFITPDFAGEAIAVKLEQAGSFPAITNIVSRSHGIMIVCDSVQVRDAGPQEDLFAMKIGSYIEQLQPSSQDPKRKRVKSGPAIAVVFTKSDTCPEAEENPDLFATNNMPRFVDFCRRSLPNHRFFAASVIGSACSVADDDVVQRQIPLHVEPRGVVEPLHWLMEQS